MATPRRTSSSHQLGVSTPLQLKRLASLSDVLGPAFRPGQALIMLLAAASVLAILVMSLLVFVGRRPDPRVTASAHRLGSPRTD